MRRGISDNVRRDFVQKSHPNRLVENTLSNALSTKKLRKIKALESETRSQSARSPSRDSRSRAETSRTRSVSPAPYVPPVGVKLPLQKFFKLYSKIVVQLETVKSYAENKTNETENLIDLRRQLQRADEFSIRFSRNNLYETKRIINEIKQLIVPYPFEGLSEADCKILCKKVILAYQAASQSLQTYINYAKNPSNLEVPDKINELVLLIADLFLCCEHLSLPADEVYIQNDAVKVCNELMNLLKSKMPVFEYVELKEADLTKKKPCTPEEEAKKMKKLSMYMKKLTPKIKNDPPKKKFGMHCLLATKARKMKKSEEKKARITHEIYTQKMNPRRKEFGSKAVKFGAEAEGQQQQQQQQKEAAGAEKRLILRRPRYVTPREVRSQDDDVETMIQTIGNDDVSSSRLGSTPREIDEVSNVSSSPEKSTFRELLLEAMEELHNPNERERKATLKKLLNSLQSCSRGEKGAQNNERVKFFHFVAEDDGEEKERVDPDVREEEERERKGEKSEKAKDEEGEGEERKERFLFEPLAEKVVAGEEGEQGEQGKRGSRARLEMTEEAMNNAKEYRKAFAEYRKSNIMYRKTLANKPWELVDKISDRIILDMIKEISLDLENDAILRRLYLNELQVLS